MGKVIRIADWLAARGTPPTAPAGAALPVPKKPAAHNGWEECDSCAHADSELCDRCEDADQYEPGDEEDSSRNPNALPPDPSTEERT